MNNVPQLMYDSLITTPGVYYYYCASAQHVCYAYKMGDGSNCPKCVRKLTYNMTHLYYN